MSGWIILLLRSSLFSILIKSISDIIIINLRIGWSVKEYEKSQHEVVCELEARLAELTN
jgi:hypothetical protein